MVSESSSVPPGDTDVSTSAESAAGTAAAREAGARADGCCVVQSCRSQGGGGKTATVSRSPNATKHSWNDSEAPGLSRGQDEDGDVFHSALQLADEDEGHNMEGLVGGCAALVRRDTFYGDVQV